MRRGDAKNEAERNYVKFTEMKRQGEIKFEVMVRINEAEKSRTILMKINVLQMRRRSTGSGIKKEMYEIICR